MRSVWLTGWLQMPRSSVAAWAEVAGCKLSLTWLHWNPQWILSTSELNSQQMIISYFLRGNGLKLNLEEFTLNYQRNFMIQSHIMNFDDHFPDQNPKLTNYGTLCTWNSAGSNRGNSSTSLDLEGPFFLRITGTSGPVVSPSQKEFFLCVCF